MRIRPAPSGSTSTAPESRKRLNPRVSAWAKESDWSFSATFFHASSEKRKRHVSRPRVITIFLPSALANDFGKVTRFFSSNVCSYSPINIKSVGSHFLPQSLDYTPLLPTASHSYPQHKIKG